MHAITIHLIVLNIELNRAHNTNIEKTGKC